jgi:predicted nucleotidyltransferase
MTPELPPLVRRTVLRLIRAFAPERIAVFGSYAKSTVHQGSDVDLLVIAPAWENPSLQHRRARQLAGDAFPPVDIVFATPEDIAEAEKAHSPFLHSILGTCVTVYDRQLNDRR